MMDEGRLLPDGSGGFEYEYFLKDHLGNTRVSFIEDASGNASIQGEDHYYPFGMTFDGMSVSVGTENKYKYNGKELQDDVFGGVGLDWYDYGARMYDPALGRWHVPDPLLEKFSHVSPFIYAMDNPISILDGDGMQPWPINDKWNGYTRRLGDGYGWRESHPFYKTRKMHNGMDMDYSLNDLSAPIYATHDGTIVEIRSTDKGGYGKYIVIRAADGSIQTKYAHLDKLSSGLKKGSRIWEGQQIGEMGTTGGSKGVHLHYELQQKGANGGYSAINPMLANGTMIDPQAMLDNSPDYNIAVATDKIAGIDKKMGKLGERLKGGKISQEKYDRRMGSLSLGKTLQRIKKNIWQMKKDAQEDE